MQDVKASIEDMVAQLNGLPLNEVRSVAIPALSCGLGGLPWSEVEPMMATALKELHPNIVATIIPPQAAPQLKTGLQQSTKTRTKTRRMIQFHLSLTLSGSA
jgi:O-acetyl-ADP-ribose deacetylase (regulator of RNase III)